VPDHDDIPISEEERQLAEKGEAIIAAAVGEVRASQSLRESIERDRARSQAAPPPSLWRRIRPALAVSLAVVAALVLAVAVLRGGSEESAPSLANVEAATRLSATDPAPASRGGDPPVLAANVGALDFPDWQQSFGWTAVGARHGSVDGRAVTTVYYRNTKGARLGYSVLAGDPVDEPAPGHKVVRDGKAFSVQRHGSRTTVVWTQQGHTCVIVASANVPPSNLVDLAASRA
jgi:hypothetical protein